MSLRLACDGQTSPNDIGMVVGQPSVSASTLP